MLTGQDLQCVRSGDPCNYSVTYKFAICSFGEEYKGNKRVRWPPHLNPRRVGKSPVMESIVNLATA